MDSPLFRGGPKTQQYEDVCTRSEVAQALILERERKLAELKADLARKKGELAKARRTPTSLAYGDLILKDLF